MKTKLFRHLGLKVFAVIALFGISTSSISAVYKWTDENGKVHYSDKPFDEKSKTVKMKRQRTNEEIIQAKERASSLLRHQNKIQEIADEEARDKKRDDQKKAKQQRKLTSLCQQAKREIRILSQGRVTYNTDENGKKHYLSDAEKNQQIAALQQQIKENCQN